MIRNIERVTKHHVRADDRARIGAHLERHILAQLRIVDLCKRLLAERERILELRDQLRLRPHRLHRIGGRRVGHVLRCLHITERIAEQNIVAHEMLRDIPDRQLRRRRLVAKLRLRNRIKGLREVTLEAKCAGLEGGGDRIFHRCGRRLLRGECRGEGQREERGANLLHQRSPGRWEGRKG